MHFFRSCIVVILYIVLGQHSVMAAPFRIYIDSSDGNTDKDLSICSVLESEKCRLPLTALDGFLSNPDFFSMVEKNDLSVQVVFAPGNYRINRPLNIRWPARSPKNELLIEGANGVVVSGSVPLTSAALIMNPSDSRISPRLSSSIVAYDVSSLFSREIKRHASGYGRPILPVATELFIDDTALPLARWPNTGFSTIASVISGSTPHIFSIAGLNLDKLYLEPELFAHGFWKYNWASEKIRISSIDTKKGTLTLQGGGANYGLVAGQRIRLENALSLLDSPGEWFLDSANKILYYYPAAAGDDKKAELSLADGALRLNSSSYVTVKRIAFSRFRGDVIFCNNCNNVLFDGLSIKNTANRAVIISRSSATGLQNSRLNDCGEGGVYLGGGHRATLQPGGNFVRKSVIENFSRLGMSYRFAVEIDGVGQIVDGNYIENGPHGAIRFSGNDHLILNNHITKVVQETSDAGVIYTGRDFTARGTVISNNFIANVQPLYAGFDVRGIYLDDQASGIKVLRNVFFNVTQPVFIGGGRDNLVRDNIFYKSGPAVTLDARGLNWQRAYALNPTKEFIQGLYMVPYQSDLYRSRYPHLANILTDDYGAPKYNVIDRNIAVSGAGPKIYPEAYAGNYIGKFFDQNSISSPFTSGENVKKPLDFLISTSSAVFSSGFSQGDLALIPVGN